MTDPGEITRLLLEVREGDAGAMDRLFDRVYGELRERARFQRAGGSPTLDTAALVHETYLKLAASSLQFADRQHFFRVAARAMRQIVIDHARSLRTLKRGLGVVPLDLESLEVGEQPAALAAESLMALDDALSRLAEHSPRLAEVVEFRFFGGLSVEETAAALDLSERTVKRDWRLARAFLQRELAQGDGG